MYGIVQRYVEWSMSKGVYLRLVHEVMSKDEFQVYIQRGMSKGGMNKQNMS